MSGRRDSGRCIDQYTAFMNIYLHTSLSIGLDEWLDVSEESAGGTSHSFQRSSSLNGRLIHTSEAVAHIVHCTQYPMLLLHYMQGDIS